MAKLTLMPSGINASITSDHTRKPGVRSACKGWSAGACRRNARFLRSVIPDKLDGFSFTGTFTVAQLPASAVEWAAIRKLFLQRLEHMGVFRLHWVTEWTKRGFPHLHLVMFFDAVDDWMVFDIEQAWLDVAGHLGSAPQGQNVTKMTDAVGWFGYVSKHSARGSGHYQRQMEGLPETWQSIGRVWGKRGEWECWEENIEVEDAVFYELRRLVRAYLTAQAREELRTERKYGNVKRISAAERRVRFASTMLRCNRKNLSTVRGLGHWVPSDVQQELLACAWYVAAMKTDLHSKK